MATARIRTKSSRGERKCGAVGCGKEIQAGEKYYSWTFRYGGRQVRCMEHPPKHSELTQSKMATVYDAIEAAENDLGTLDEIKAAIENVAKVTREVVDEYREAAEHFGGSGQNAENADELEGWVDELDQFDPEEIEEEEFNEEEHQEEASERTKQDSGLTIADAMQAIREEWEEDKANNIEEKLEDIRGEASELLNSCPL